MFTKHKKVNKHALPVINKKKNMTFMLAYATDSPIVL